MLNGRRNRQVLDTTRAQARWFRLAPPTSRPNIWSRGRACAPTACLAKCLSH